MNFESRRGQDENIADDEQNKYAVNLYKEGGVDVSFITNIKFTYFKKGFLCLKLALNVCVCVCVVFLP